MSFERRLNRHDISRRYSQSEPANERLLNREDVSRRKAEPRIYGGGDVVIIGPCTPFTPDEGSPDTDFETVYPGGCPGPNRLGLNLKNLNDNTTTFAVLEYESSSPLTLSTDSFSFSCADGSHNCYAKAVFTSSDQYDEGTGNGAVLSLYTVAGDVLKQTWVNAFGSWEPMSAGNLQLGPDNGWCDCLTIPYEVCLSIPTR